MRKSNVRLQEIAPPWVATDLLPGAKEDPRAMPIKPFIEQSFKILETDAFEVVVTEAEPLRNNAGPNEHAFVEQLNEMMGL